MNIIYDVYYLVEILSSSRALIQVKLNCVNHIASCGMLETWASHWIRLCCCLGWLHSNIREFPKGKSFCQWIIILFRVCVSIDPLSCITMLNPYLLAFNQCISIILWVKFNSQLSTAKQKENDYSIHMPIVIIINLSFLFHFVCFLFIFSSSARFLSAVKIYKKKLNPSIQSNWIARLKAKPATK